MVLLTIYNEATTVERGRKKSEQVQVDSLEAAIRAGQESGRYYEVYDLKTGRTIDWNEVNVTADDDWYYDEADMIWRMRRDDESVEEPMNQVFDWLLGVRNNARNYQLSC